MFYVMYKKPQRSLDKFLLTLQKNGFPDLHTEIIVEGLAQSFCKWFFSIQRGSKANFICNESLAVRTKSVNIGSPDRSFRAQEMLSLA